MVGGTTKQSLFKVIKDCFVSLAKTTPIPTSVLYFRNENNQDKNSGSAKALSQLL